jgi:hypothetical protein
MVLSSCCPTSRTKVHRIASILRVTDSPTSRKAYPLTRVCYHVLVESRETREDKAFTGCQIIADLRRLCGDDQSLVCSSVCFRPARVKLDFPWPTVILKRTR